MKVCTTYGAKMPLKADATMHEIRLDVFDAIPDGVDDESLITLCGKDISMVPDSFNGLVDVGDSDIETSHRKIRSIHDFEKTPDADEIFSMLNKGDQEISKGAFKASSFTDLYSILEASKKLERKHVLLGMGTFGEITRIRQKVLRNEFTFGYEGIPTAAGQLSSTLMERLGDECNIVGIVGHPLGHTRSPAMQNAAMRERWINGRYIVFDAPDLNHIEDVIRGYQIKGLNVTIPYKKEIIPHLDKVTGRAEGVGAVNTIINRDDVLTGDNTDVDGILYAMTGVKLDGKKVLIMGSGGAARAAAFTYMTSGCETHIAGRNEKTVNELCNEFGTKPYNGSIKGFDIVVNCTPVGLVYGEYPADISDMHKDQTIFDMVYGIETPLTSKAASAGCRIIDGKEMLIGQGAASFREWFKTIPDTDVMRDALQ